MPKVEPVHNIYESFLFSFKSGLGKIEKIGNSVAGQTKPGRIYHLANQAELSLRPRRNEGPRHKQKGSTRLRSDLFVFQINHGHPTDKSDQRPMITSGLPDINTT